MDVYKTNSIMGLTVCVDFNVMHASANNCTCVCSNAYVQMVAYPQNFYPEVYSSSETNMVTNMTHMIIFKNQFS